MNTGTILWLISSLLLTGWGKAAQPCCKNFNPVLVHRLGPGDPLFGHVQGLEINDDYFFLTAVSLNRESGFLYIYPRTGAIGRAPIHRYDLWKLARRRASACGPLDNGPLNHPSGIHLRGTLLNVAIAPSANRGPTCVLILDMKDPANPDVVRAVRIDDHIGAVVQLSVETMIGYIWGSEDYWWLDLESPPRRVAVRERRNDR